MRSRPRKRAAECGYLNQRSYSSPVDRLRTHPKTHNTTPTIARTSIAQVCQGEALHEHPLNNQRRYLARNENAGRDCP